MYYLFMSNVDKIKEQIGWLKVVFGLLFATDISIVAYLFNNLERLNNLKVIIILLALSLVTLGILYINKKAMKKIDSLEKL